MSAKALCAAIAVLAVAAGAGSVVLATIPDSGSAIHAWFSVEVR